MASDVSNSGLGTVLLHKENGQLKALHHATMTLLLAKINNSQTEKKRG